MFQNPEVLRRRGNVDTGMCVEECHMKVEAETGGDASIGQGWQAKHQKLWGCLQWILLTAFRRKQAWGHLDLGARGSRTSVVSATPISQYFVTAALVNLYTCDCILSNSSNNNNKTALDMNYVPVMC